MRNGSLRVAGLLAALLGAACGGRPGAEAPAAAVGATATAAGALKFIEDDAPKALAEAKTRGVPVFVEAWAPW